MYMNGHRGPMGGPARRRPVEFFPVGGLFILPALMFGGWTVLAVLGGILALFGNIIGGVFRGLSSLASGAFSGIGVAAGIAIGLLLFAGLKKRKAAQHENIGTVDGEETAGQVVEPVEYQAEYRQMYR